MMASTSDAPKALAVDYGHGVIFGISVRWRREQGHESGPKEHRAHITLRHERLAAKTVTQWKCVGKRHASGNEKGDLSVPFT